MKVKKFDFFCCIIIEKMERVKAERAVLERLIDEGFFNVYGLNHYMKFLARNVFAGEKIISLYPGFYKYGEIFNRPVYAEPNSGNFGPENPHFDISMVDDYVAKYGYINQRHLALNKNITIDELMNCDKFYEHSYLLQRDDITEDFIMSHRDVFNDDRAIFGCKNISESCKVEILDKYKENHSWVSCLADGVTPTLIEEFPNLCWDFDYLSAFMPIDFIAANPQYAWNYKSTTLNKSITIDFIKEHRNRLAPMIFPRGTKQRIDSWIEENSDLPWDLKNILCFNNVSAEFVDRLDYTSNGTKMTIYSKNEYLTWSAVQNRKGQLWYKVALCCNSMLGNLEV